MLAEKLFGQEQGKSIKKLWEDKETRRFMIKEASKQMLESRELFPAHPFEQIQALLYDNSFASDEETVYVGGIVKKFILRNPKEIFPYVTEQNGIELAERCLIACGFFRTHMQSKSKRQQYPSVQFYEEVGRTIFQREEVYNLGTNFDRWTNKLHTLAI